jgi:hypothetical protein
MCSGKVCEVNVGDEHVGYFLVASMLKVSIVYALSVRRSCRALFTREDVYFTEGFIDIIDDSKGRIVRRIDVG